MQFFQKHFQRSLDPLEIQKENRKDSPFEVLYIDVSRSHLVSIEQIIVFSNCIRLDLTSNKLTDITPLGQLVQLQGLLLQGNQIESVKPLSSLKQLVKLDLSVNRISDISPLQGCVALQDLDLRGNQINAFEQLACLSRLLQLRRLMLHYGNGNKVTADPCFRTKLIYLIPWLKNIDFGPVQMEDLATVWLRMRGGALIHLQGGMNLGQEELQKAMNDNKRLKEEYAAIDAEVRQLGVQWEQNHVTLLRQHRDAAK